MLFPESIRVSTREGEVFSLIFICKIMKRFYQHKKVTFFLKTEKNPILFDHIIHQAIFPSLKCK